MAKSFKIPRFNPDSHVVFKILKSGIYDNGKATRITLQKQIIEGVKIPKIEIWLPNDSYFLDRYFSSQPEVNIKGWKANQLIKFFVMEGLRNG
jgi:phosphosulfolactate synthase (CoM biosynthesis protein A)